MNKDAFDTALRSIKQRGSAVTSEFEEIVITAVQLYYGETNRNIQVINDVVDCGAVLKGIRLLALVDYLKQVIPHENKGKSGDYHFGRMDKELARSYDASWEEFLSSNPSWHEWKKEIDPAKFDVDTYVTSVIRKLNKAHKDGQLSREALDKFKTVVQHVGISAADDSVMILSGDLSSLTETEDKEEVGSFTS